MTTTYTTTFTADSSGDFLEFIPEFDDPTLTATVSFVSLEEVIHTGTNDERPVAEFLTGNSDFGKEIFFRADTQTLQLQSSPELYSNPNAVVTELERGTLVKTFVSLDDGPFYELLGTVTKGVSTLKFNVPNDEKVAPPTCQTIQISYRDSSKMLCRILQMAVLFVPTPIDHSA